MSSSSYVYYFHEENITNEQLISKAVIISYTLTEIIILLTLHLIVPRRRPSCRRQQQAYQTAFMFKYIFIIIILFHLGIPIFNYIQTEGARSNTFTRSIIFICSLMKVFLILFMLHQITPGRKQNAVNSHFLYLFIHC